MIHRVDAGPRMSEAGIHDGIVYLAGQVPEDTSAGQWLEAGGGTERGIRMEPGRKPAPSRRAVRGGPLWMNSVVWKTPPRRESCPILASP